MRPAQVILVALGLALAGAATSRPARADTQQNQSFAAWKVMQDCSKQTNKQFPDHTPEGNAKREASYRECLRVHRLPVPVTDPAPAPSR